MECIPRGRTSYIHPSTSTIGEIRGPRSISTSRNQSSQGLLPPEYGIFRCQSRNGLWSCFSEAHSPNNAVLSSTSLGSLQWRVSDRYPCSNGSTEKLLPAAIEATVLAIKSDRKDWHDPFQFPPAALELFKGQKVVLFYYGPISTAKDIELAFEKCTNIQEIEERNTNQANGRQLRYIFHQLMLKQQHHLGLQPLANSDLIYSGIDGSTLETVCSSGAFKSVDKNPRLTCARARGHVVRTTRRCKSQQCY